MRTRSLLLAGLLVVAPLAGCGDDDDDAGVTTTTAGETTTTAPDGTTTSASPATDEVGLHLDEHGLQSADGTDLSFGTGRDDVLEAVSAVLGAPVEAGEQQECPAGAVSFARFGEAGSGISLDFQDGVFVGWTLGAASALTTASGVGIGSTKAELEELYGPVQVVPDSTIGIEFFIEDGFSGVLEEDSPDGVITDLWAGTTCIFR